MRQITLHEVGMENYGPYIDPMILTFKNDNTTLLTGPNGVGKTMALDAIPFTLFGTTSKGLKGDDVVNNVIEKSCYTWVKFSVNDDNYIVKRYQKYSKFGGNNVILNKNGVDIKSGSREVIPEIERLWCSQKSFMNTLMFGQKIKDFFTDLTDSKQKEIFRKLLGLDNYVDYYKQADSKMKEVSEILRESAQQITIKQEMINEASIRIDELKKLKTQFEIDKLKKIKELEQSVEQSDRIIKEWKKATSHLKLKELDLAEMQTELDGLQRSLDNIQEIEDRQKEDLITQKDLKIFELESKANKTKEELTITYNKSKEDLTSDTQEEINKVKIDIAEITEKKHGLQLDIGKLESEVISLQKDNQKINKSVFESQISSCPVCRQEITDDVKEQLSVEIGCSDETIKTNIETIKEINTTITTYVMNIGNKESDLEYHNMNYTSELNILNDKHKWFLEEVNQRISKVLDQVETATNKQLQIFQDNTIKEISQLNQSIKELTEKKLEVEINKKKLDKAEELLQTAENGKEIILREIKQTEENEYDETQLNGYIGRSIQYTKDIEELVSGGTSEKRKYDMYEFWKSAYSPTGIPSTLIDEAIPFMNKKVGEYLEEISNGRYIISFDTQDTIKSGEMRDKISVKVLDTHTKANKRLQLSGGQTRLVDIATVLTLGDLQSKNLGMKVNLLIFDEIFDSLDAQNIDYVSKVLNRLKKGRSIYLISHTHQDQLEADEVLEFKA